MIQNKVTIAGTDYELEEDILLSKADDNIPLIWHKGKRYIGKAIPNKLEKDYEIKSIAKEKNWIGDKDVFEHYLKNGYNINQVLRLSDNYIWTIGDQTQYGRINKFYPLQTHDVGMSVECELGNCYLKDITRPQRTPLFYADNDESHICEGDEYAIVEIPSYRISRSIGMKGATKHENQLYFSTEEKAKVFVKENKPCLSLSDVKGISKLTKDNYRTYDDYDLVRLVKTKTNL